MNLREELVREALSATPENTRRALAALRSEEKPQAAAEPQGLIDVAGAMSYMGGISRTSLWRLRRNGLRSILVGKGRRCFRRKDLDDAIDKMAEESGS